MKSFKISTFAKSISRAGMVFGAAIMTLAMVVAFMPGKAEALTPQECTFGTCSLTNTSFPGFCIDTQGNWDNGDPLRMKQCTGESEQKFVFHKTANISSGPFAGQSAYVIRSYHTNKCLNVEGGSTVDGADIIQYTCGALQSPAKYWSNEQFVPKVVGYDSHGDPQVILIARHTANSFKCIVPQANIDDSILQIYPCQNTIGFRWELIPNYY